MINQAAAELSLLSGAKPFVGHAAEYLKNPVALLERGFRELGEMFEIKMGTQRFVVVLGPENNKVFFDETDKLLSIREGYPFFLKMFGKDFYFFAPHEEYLKQRALVMPRFKGPQMRSYVSIITQETQDFIDDLGEEGEIDLIPTLGPLVMNIAAHSFLGSDFRRKLDAKFFDDFRDFSGGMEVVWPLWMPLPHLRKSREARRKLDRVLADWITYRRENPVNPPDFFQSLVDSEGDDGSRISDELAINIILLLVWAGHETTAGQISWSLIDLLQHPEYLETTRSEASQILGNRIPTLMDWRDAKSLVHMELALKESERLHPVAYVLMRKAAEEITMSGYHIAKGTPLLAAPCISHRMPEVFPNPQVYDPSRFTPGTGETGPETNRLIGFGGGLHRCAGVNFARLEMKIILTMLALRFDMELIDSPRPVSGTMTHWPAQPCRVRYKIRAMNKNYDDGNFHEMVHAPANVSVSGCPFHQD